MVFQDLLTLRFFPLSSSFLLSSFSFLFPLSRVLLQVPDYLVVGPKFGWAGAGGLLAAGFWNNVWQFDVSCGYVK